MDSIGWQQMRRSAFTLIELLLVIGVVALLIGILLPVLGHARAEARRVASASNLRQLGIAHSTYATDNRGWFAAVRNASTGDPEDGQVFWRTQAAAGALLDDPFAATAPKNDLAMALFLLLRQRYAESSAVFVNASTRDTADEYEGQDVRSRVSFTLLANDMDMDGTYNLSYGYANVYGTELVAPDAQPGFKLKQDVVSSEFATMADQGPPCCGSSDSSLSFGKAGRSNIYEEEGQHAQFGDGHVAWSDTQKVGPNGTDIYGFNAADFSDDAEDVTINIYRREGAPWYGNGP